MIDAKGTAAAGFPAAVPVQAAYGHEPQLAASGVVTDVAGAWIQSAMCRAIDIGFVYVLLMYVSV